MKKGTFASLLALGVAISGLFFVLRGPERGQAPPSKDVESVFERLTNETPPDDAKVEDEGENEGAADYLASSSPHLSDPLHDEEVEPHPLTEERLRMAEHHELFEQITESLKQKDFALASKLIRRHQTEFPIEDEDEAGWEADRRGFERLLDCLETRSESARQQAEEFIQKERLSPLRRHVRRVCVGGRDF